VAQTTIFNAIFTASWKGSGEMSVTTPLLPTDIPEDVGISSGTFEEINSYMQSWIETDRAAAAAIGLARRGRVLMRGVGRMTLDSDGVVLPADAIFLVASITKPVTCAAVALLLQKGLIQIDTPVSAIVSEFRGQGKETITIHHLLTHTSGLPDMIPENMEYRKEFRPLDKFIERICTVNLLFKPGTGVSYQSTGIAMLGEIVKRITGTPLPEFLHDEFFVPLGMDDTSLGIQNIDENRIPTIRVPEEVIEAEWHWNRAYWRGLGAPWGGMFTTVRDLNIFLQTFLNGGAYGNTRILSPETVAGMIANHTDYMPDLPDEAKQKANWGLGWRLNGPTPSFGGKSPPSQQAFGHGGSTGTECWADPETGLSCALFTTQPEMYGSDEFKRVADLAVR